MTGRRIIGVLAALFAAIALAGCSVPVRMQITMNRDGAGTVTVRAGLDAEAQQYLNLPAGASGDEIAAKIAPWATAAKGWESAGASAVSADRDGSGTLTLQSSHRFVSSQELQRLLGETRQPTAILVKTGDRPPTDMPADVPLMNAFNVSLTAHDAPDPPSFNLFGRGGIGAIATATCSGAALERGTSTDRALRKSLRFEYVASLPVKPTRTTGTAAKNDPTQVSWNIPFGDCPRISANSTQGSSSAVLNGIILLGAGLFIAVVLLLRGLKGRRARRSLTVRG